MFTGGNAAFAGFTAFADGSLGAPQCRPARVLVVIEAGAPAHPGERWTARHRAGLGRQVPGLVADDHRVPTVRVCMDDDGCLAHPGTPEDDGALDRSGDQDAGGRAPAAPPPRRQRCAIARSPRRVAETVEPASRIGDRRAQAPLEGVRVGRRRYGEGSRGGEILADVHRIVEVLAAVHARRDGDPGSAPGAGPEQRTTAPETIEEHVERGAAGARRCARSMTTGGHEDHGGHEHDGAATRLTRLTTVRSSSPGCRPWSARDTPGPRPVAAPRPGTPA